VRQRRDGADAIAARLRAASNLSSTNEKAAAGAAFFARRGRLFARLALATGVAC